MTHCIFIAPPLSGHLRPMRALAAALRDLGHRTSFLHMSDIAPLLGADDHLLAAGARTHPAGTLAAQTARIGALRGFLGLRPVLRDLAANTSMLCDQGPALLRAAHAGLVVADQAEAAGGLIARHLRLPYVSVANALPLNRDVSIPPPFTGWTHDPTPYGRWRNRGGLRVSDALSRPLHDAIARIAAAWQLGPLRTLSDCLSPDLQLSQLVPGLDLPRPPIANFHYTGPLRRPEPPLDLPLPPAPFAYVSLGTLQGGRASLLAAIAAECARVGLSCLIAHGGRLDPRRAAALPPTTVVTDFVPQRAVLAHAALCVTHGGMNTVLDALAAAVPTLAIPLAFEQGAIAALLVRSGAGLRGRRALGRLHAEPAFAARAAVLAHEISTSGGALKAAWLIHQEARGSAP